MNSPDLDDQLEPDVYSNLPSSTGITTRRRNRSSFRSKHSETEQRRRSKINERFQSLMDIIPQHDHKRDKASFLLEVIEYIHFLQDKVQMYEGSPHMWHQPPTKLIPWRNNQGSVAAPSALSAATEPVPQSLHHESSQSEMANSGENTPPSLSTVCSQRVLHTLTDALKSSGVNMSETMISVKLSLRKISDPEYPVTGFTSEDNGDSIADEEADFPSETEASAKF